MWYARTGTGNTTNLARIQFAFRKASYDSEEVRSPDLACAVTRPAACGLSVTNTSLFLPDRTRTAIAAFIELILQEDIGILKEFCRPFLRMVFKFCVVGKASVTPPVLQMSIGGDVLASVSMSARLPL